VIRALIALQKSEANQDSVLTDFTHAVTQLSNYGFEVIINRERLKDSVDEILKWWLIFSRLPAWGKITRIGLQLQLKDVQFWSIAHGLPAIIKYLTEKGCINVQWTFIEIPYSED
jgi:hypothetical protein